MTKHYDNLSQFLMGFDTVSWARFLGTGATTAKMYPADLSTVASNADSILLLGEKEDRAAHVELQARYDSDIDRRLVMYYGIGWRKLNLPLSSFLVLLRRAADGPHITGVVRNYDSDDGSLILEFHYKVIRVWELSADELLNSGLGTMPLAFAANASEDKLPEMVRFAEERLNREAQPGTIGDFGTSIGLLMGLRYSRDVVLEQLKGVHAMKESEFYKIIAEECEAVGEARGIAIGEARGEARGLMLGKRATLLRMATKKFGAGPDAPSKLTIEAIDSPDRLDDLIERCLMVASWAELLGK